MPALRPRRLCAPIGLRYIFTAWTPQGRIIPLWGRYWTFWRTRGLKTLCICTAGPTMWKRPCCPCTALSSRTSLDNPGRVTSLRPSRWDARLLPLARKKALSGMARTVFCSRRATNTPWPPLWRAQPNTTRCLNWQAEKPPPRQRPFSIPSATRRALKAC